MLIDDRFDGFVGIFCDGILEPANKLIVRDCSAEAGEEANQIIKFIQVESDVGTVLVF